MSIVPLVRVTLCGPSAEKDVVLDDLQGFGCLHLNELRSGGTVEAAAASIGDEAREAVQYLQDSPVRRQPLKRTTGVDLEAVIKETLDIRQRARALDEEREQLRKWITDLEPWGDFEMPEWALEGPLHFWFYVVPNHKIGQVQTVDLPWRIVARDNRFSYVVVVAADQPAGMPVAPVSLEHKSLSFLRSRLEKVERELEELDYRRIGMTLYNDILRNFLDEADNRAAREQAARKVLERDHVFAVQGWSPAERASALRRYASDSQLAVIIEEPGPHDSPPTLLRNATLLSSGEDMVTFYKTPSYRMWDPSKAVFAAFAVFFAMIFSDAGYGLLLGIILAATWKRLGRSAGGRGMRGLLLTLAAASTIYGILVGTYFGVKPEAGTRLAALQILNVEDQGLMMWISLGVGALHLGYANLVSAWRRKSSASLGAVGWACIFLGGFCAGLGKSYTDLAWLFVPGWVGLGLGGFLVLFFSSEQPFSLALKPLLHRFLEGLKGVTELSKAFGDLLSYLRLFALGLASIKLAEAFNSLAASSFEIRGLGVLLGLLILVIGHGINFSMGVMGGVVHGLRLNVIEFFNWSLPEEGEQFQAFAKKS